MNRLNFYHCTFFTIGTFALVSCGPMNDMKEMKTTTAKMSDTTDQMNGNTAEMLILTRKLEKLTEEMSATTKGMSKKTDEMAGTTKEMLAVTQGMAKTTDRMAGTTDRMAGTTDQMLTVTQGMSKTTDKMAGTTDQMLTVTQGMSKTTDKMAGTTGEMLGVTKDMAKTTKGMATTTSGMAKTTDHLATLTTGMSTDLKNAYTDGRMDSSSTRRQKALEGMDIAKDIESKIGFAGTYFYSMEFQFWKSDREEKSTRAILLKNMTMEFLQSIQNYTDNDFSDYDVSPVVESNRKNNLFALMAAMHVISETQTKALTGQEKPESMLSILEESLSAKKDLVRTHKSISSLPDYQQEALKYEPLVTYLLQVRQSFLKGAALCLSSAKMTGEKKSKIALAWELVREKFSSTHQWTPDFKNQNTSQINKAAEALEWSTQTSEFLLSIGITPAPQTSIDDLLSRMDLSSFNSKENKSKDIAIARLKRAVKKSLSMKKR